MAEVTARKRNDKWEYRIELAKVNGKRQQKSKGGFKTKAEALKQGREALKLYENGGQYITPSEISVSDLLDMWIAEVSKTELQQTTVDGYVKKIRLYIKPVIGGYQVKAITRQTLQEMINDLADKGFSKNTVSSIRGIVTSCFDWAEYNKHISQSPAYRLKIPKNTEVKTRTEPHVYIPQDMISKIFERFPEGHTSYLPLMLAYHCGLRLGEAFGLVWNDIDLDKKTLTINRQVQWKSFKKVGRGGNRRSPEQAKEQFGYWYFSTPKYDSFRTIDLDDTITDLLRKEKAKQEKALAYYEAEYTRYYVVEPLEELNTLHNPISTEATENEIYFVCRRENGEYITPRTMQHTSSVIHKQLEFPEFDYHSLRHTHATILREHGTPEIYIQHRLGHSKLETTQKVYTNHLTELDKKNGYTQLNSLF